MCEPKDIINFKVDTFVENLLFGQALTEDCDQSEDQIEQDFQLPPWFDEDKFKRGQQHFKNNKFILLELMIVGVVCVFTIPNIARVLTSSGRANTPVTSYRRYVSALLHVLSWLEKPLAPETEVWRSLKAIRLRHLRASRVAQKRDYGIIGQGDVALTQACFVTFCILKSKQFSLLEEIPGDEEGFVHVWRVIGYMLGLKDRYNICRPDPEETKAVCRKIVDIAYVPYLIEPPEYSLHLIDSMINALGVVFPHLTTDMFCYFSKWLAGVPGYEYADSDLVLMRNLLKNRNSRATENGMSTKKPSSQREYKTLSNDPLDALKVEDYSRLETIPAYQNLLTFEKWVLSTTDFLHRNVNTNYLGRIFLNNFTNFGLFLVEYFPVLAIYKFGIKMAYINKFAESLKDDTLPQTNAEVLKETNKAK